MPICKKQKCIVATRRVVTKPNDDESAAEYWSRVRNTQLPCFWNTIQTRIYERMSDEDILKSAIENPDNLLSLVRSGGKKEVIDARCENCNSKI